MRWGREAAGGALLCPWARDLCPAPVPPCDTVTHTGRVLQRHLALRPRLHWHAPAKCQTGSALQRGLIINSAPGGPEQSVACIGPVAHPHRGSSAMVPCPSPRNPARSACFGDFSVEAESGGWGPGGHRNAPALTVPCLPTCTRGAPADAPTAQFKSGTSFWGPLFTRRMCVPRSTRPLTHGPHSLLGLTGSNRPPTCAPRHLIVRTEFEGSGAGVPLAPAGSDMIRWRKVLLSDTLDAARSY